MHVNVRIVSSMLVCVTVSCYCMLVCVKLGYIYVMVHVLELYDVKNLMS